MVLVYFPPYYNIVKLYLVPSLSPSKKYIVIPSILQYCCTLPLFPPSLPLNGCLFYWKQALRRKMMDLKISREHISISMTKNVVDALIVIPRHEIERKGIPYVCSILDIECNSNKERENEMLFGIIS